MGQPFGSWWTGVRFVVVAALSASLTFVSGCETLKENPGKVAGAVLGTLTGAGACYLAGGNDKTCIAVGVAGGILGYKLGEIYDKRRERLEAAAQKTGTDIACEKVEPSVVSEASKDGNDTVEGYVATVNREEMFPIGSSVPTTSTRNAFTELARVYAEKAALPDGTTVQTQILVTGHTDSTGTADLNQRLSEQRARAIAEIMTHAGLAPDRLYLQGAGSSQPIASNDTAVGRALNRRVEILEITDEAGLLSYAEMRRRDARFLAHSSSRPKPKAPETSRPSESVPARPSSTVVVDDGRSVADTVRPASDGSAVIDFGGRPVSGMNDRVSASSGQPTMKSSVLSRLVPVSAAQASESVASACFDDSPRISGDVISFKTGRSVEQRRETGHYLPGMDERVWSVKVNGYLVAIAPVSVLRKDGAVLNQPQVFVYESGTQKLQSATSAIAQSYVGEHGVLYRVFLEAPERPVECLDVALPVKGKFQAMDGLLFYKVGDAVYQTEYLPSAG